MEYHTKLMQQVLELARRAENPSPNPYVGCIIEKEGTIIASAWHEQAGMEHAEILALKQAGINAFGATLYVNLEPCCHYGLTPPCVDAIIKSGIKKAFVAIKDPNPKVNGKGIAALRDAGIEVHLGLCEKEALLLNESFFHFISTGKPYVRAKWAMSLDGKIAAFNGNSKWISNELSRQHAHTLRKQADAIIVGANTVLLDDPELTARVNGNSKQPIRIVLASKTLPINLKIFKPESLSKTILVTTLSSNIYRELEHVEIVTLANDNGVCLDSLLSELGKRKITNILVEGGAHVLTSFFSKNLIDKAYIYIAPKLIGGKEALSPILGQGKSIIPQLAECDFEHIERAGGDLIITANMRKGRKQCSQE